MVQKERQGKRRHKEQKKEKRKRGMGSLPHGLGMLKMVDVIHPPSDQPPPRVLVLSRQATSFFGCFKDQVKTFGEAALV